jgi:2-dehydro-3-deoxy-D-arabinonate dehydratase
MSLPSITVYRTAQALFAQRGEDCFQLVETNIDTLFTSADPAAWLQEQLAAAKPALLPEEFLAPIGSQEVWAAGVTYLRSRDARMEEAKDAGGGTFYDRVYDAERPEIFFKATPNRVVGQLGAVRLRSDSKWNVPEPEVTLAINRDGQIFGYTIGNDMSSRDIEGENPLYLPQAKVYAGCCGLGPGVVVRSPLPRDTEIQIHIWRAGSPVFSGKTSLAQMKRTFTELAGFLFRDNEFPHGCFLLTGTGTVPPNDFTLASGDEIRIHVAGLGTLTNAVG